jgi:hypothetical protein
MLNTTIKNNIFMILFLLLEDTQYITWNNTPVLIHNALHTFLNDSDRNDMALNSQFHEFPLKYELQ